MTYICGQVSDLFFSLLCTSKKGRADKKKEGRKEGDGGGALQVWKEGRKKERTRNCQETVICEQFPACHVHWRVCP